jgi:hypothetical protein
MEHCQERNYRVKEYIYKCFDTYRICKWLSYFIEIFSWPHFMASSAEHITCSKSW